MLSTTILRLLQDLAVYDLDNISLRDVAITWDDKRMICVGSVITSPKDYQRENSPPLNHIIGMPSRLSHGITLLC